MALKDDVMAAIAAHPAIAQEALVALQEGVVAPVTLDSLWPIAKERGKPLAEVAATHLEGKGLLGAYAIALEGRGVILGGDDGEPQAGPEEQRLVNFAAFERIGHAAACRIVLGEPGRITGSGCLIGPSLVLTAWHVISSNPPGQAGAVQQPLSVLLADGVRRSVGEVVLQSECTAEEYSSCLPRNEAGFSDRNDFALLRLTRADGARLNFIPVPETPPLLRTKASLFVLDFPAGRNEGWGMGKVQRIPRIKARVQHDAPGDGGSSGAACVNNRFQLVGVHQGRWNPARRMVPLERFHQVLRTTATADIAPEFLWSLNGQLDGPLIFGRDLFFEGVAAAAQPGARVRGLKVKRLDPAKGTAGLAFSFEMLKRVLRRNPNAHQFVRITFDPPFRDLIEEIRLRAAGRGVGTPAEVEAGGVRAGETTPEAAVGDRARRLAEALDAEVGASGQDHLLWFLFENPVAGLTDAERFAFEAFVGAVLKQPRLRLVLAGFETTNTPGLEFGSAGEAGGSGAPGLVVEHIGRFTLRDIEVLVERAAKALAIPLNPGQGLLIAKAALVGLPAMGGFYDAVHSDATATKVAEGLATAQAMAGVGG